MPDGSPEDAPLAAPASTANNDAAQFHRACLTDDEATPCHSAPPLTRCSPPLIRCYLPTMIGAAWNREAESPVIMSDWGEHLTEVTNDSVSRYTNCLCPLISTSYSSCSPSVLEGCRALWMEPGMNGEACSDTNWGRAAAACNTNPAMMAEVQAHMIPLPAPPRSIAHSRRRHCSFQTGRVMSHQNSNLGGQY